MKKRTILIISIILALTIAISGCNLVEVNEERDADTIVIKVNDESITKGEYQQIYNYIKYNYQITEAQLQDPEYAQMVQDVVIEEAITRKILEIKAREYGCYDFTEEELAEINSNVQITLEQYRGLAESSVTANEANSEKTQEELDELIEDEYQDFLERVGFDEQEYIESEKEQMAYDKIIDIISEFEPITDIQIENEFKLRIAEQRSEFQTGIMDYEQAIANGDTIYYHLDSLRKVRHILIALPKEVQDEIRSYRNNEANEEADARLQEELPLILEKAQQVLGLAQSGEDFDELIAEYGEDPGMTEDNYYVVAEESIVYVTSFAQGVYSIEELDGISDLVATDFGYHIIKYIGDTVVGEIPFDEVKEDIKKELEQTASEENRNNQMEAWKEEADTKIYTGKLD